MSEQPGSNSDRRDPLGFDEILALLIAFSAVGAILWWSLGRKAESWIGQRWMTAPSTGEVAPSDPSLAPSLTEAAPSPEARITTPDRLETPLPSPVPTAPSADSRVNAPVVVAPIVVGRSPAAEAPALTEPLPSAAFVVPPPQTTVSFPDVPAGYWALPFITELSRRGIITGFEDGTFRPDQPLTRAQYAALLEKVLQNANQTPIAFSDIPAGFWGTQAVNEAVKSGFLKGYPNATFQPNQPISKVQVLLSLANGFQLPQSVNPDVALQVFQDREQIADWAKPAVAAATESGVVVNYPNRDQFNPNQPATRAEVAAMLYQALTANGQLQPIQSNYIVRP